MQSSEQALIMSSDQVMISLFLPFPALSVGMCACLHACALSGTGCLFVCVSVCLSLVPCGVSVGPEELCLIV